MREASHNQIYMIEYIRLMKSKESWTEGGSQWMNRSGIETQSHSLLKFEGELRFRFPAKPGEVSARRNSIQQRARLCGHWVARGEHRTR